MKFDHDALLALVRFLAEEDAKLWLEEVQQKEKERAETLLQTSTDTPDSESASG